MRLRLVAVRYQESDKENKSIVEPLQNDIGVRRVRQG